VQVTSAAHWRLAVGERHMVGSLVDGLARCETTGKVRYDTLIEAWVAAFVDFADDAGLAAFVCGECHGAHLGHPRRKDGRAGIRVARRSYDAALAQMFSTIRELREQARPQGKAKPPPCRS